MSDTYFKARNIRDKMKGGKGLDGTQKQKEMRRTLGWHVWIATRITLGGSRWLSDQALGHFGFWAVPASAILTLSY